MRTFKPSAIQLGLSALFSVSAVAFSGTAAAGPIPAGYTCTGNCGTLGANGVVTGNPAGGDYLYVSTDGAPDDTGLALGNETNGSRLKTPDFAASANASLVYHFNFVTSDGAGFSDYAWARLFDADTDELVTLLFTARTTPGGNTVPGSGMDPLGTGVLLDPASVIIPVPGNGTEWSPLGNSSNTCWSAGCGHTGWVKSTYTLAIAGNYFLEFGVVNWADTSYQTGLAIGGITVDGKPIDPNPTIPEPATLGLLGLGLLGLAAARRRKAA